MSPDILKLIEISPKIMFGKPVIKGTRIPVDLVLERFSYGITVDEILSSYPNLTRESIFACLHYATLQLRNEHF